MNGRQLYKLGSPHIGEKYVLGTIVPKNLTSYDGPWDCAEFASWLVFQLTGKLYGCANNNGDPLGADAYSGFWGRDAEVLGKKITVDEAATIPGAIVLRLAGHGLIGHVVMSNGAGATIEAHSTKAGVIQSTLHGRRWDYGVLIPWIEYDVLDANHPPVKKPGMIYRYTSPMMTGEKVREIQLALGFIRGRTADGIFGPKTHNSVKAFQRNQSLVADGEVGLQTATKLGITI